MDTGHGAVVGYYAQEHETLDPTATVEQTLAHAAPELDDSRRRTILGSFLFSGESVRKPTGVLSGGEKTRLSSPAWWCQGQRAADEPTNNLDPASRSEVLHAIRQYGGAVVLVSHDPGAVEALEPERVVLLPDGDEDLWR